MAETGKSWAGRLYVAASQTLSQRIHVPDIWIKHTYASLLPACVQREVRVLKSARLLPLGLAAVVAAPAHATLVTLNGSSVDFVIDDSQLGLYGMPTVAGDSLLFFPTNFRAESTNGAGTHLTNGTISFEVRSRNGTTVDLGAVSVYEFGDYSITPNSGNSVSASARLDAVNLQAPVPPASDKWDIQQTGTLTASGVNDWSLVTNVNFRQVWLSPTDDVQVVIQNNLSATSLLNGTEAWIQKKVQGLVVQVQVVPLPAALPLLLTGLAGFGVFVRRRGSRLAFV